MSDYLTLFLDQLTGYARWVTGQIVHLDLTSYFWWLVGLSFATYALELIAPWRRDQARIRKDFWLDTGYMFFNFFGVGLLGYVAVSAVVEAVFLDALEAAGVDSLATVSLAGLPAWAQLVVFFVVRDFIQWNVHRLLHRVPFLWELHKVHHSVEQMGYAAHLRFHWGETVVYKTLEYVPLALLGFSVEQFLVVHVVALAIGHLNHANVAFPLGPLRFVFNHAAMHIWHHARDLPPERRLGVNFGLSLSVWDWLFGTAWMPRDGRDVPLGFPGVEAFPTTFLRQIVHPLGGRTRA